MNEKNTDRWDYDNQIFFHYGNGYGLTTGLRTVCLGTEEDVKKRFPDFYYNNPEPQQNAN